MNHVVSAVRRTIGRTIGGALLALAVLAPSLKAQAPQAVNYQAIARTADGNPVVGGAVGVRLTITDGPGGTTLYQETHLPVTNNYGVFNLAIGRGTASSGDFAAIDWGGGERWLAVEVDPLGGTDYTVAGTQQLLSVPYALYANEAGNGGGAGDGWSLIGNSISPNPGENFLGTLNETRLDIRTNNADRLQINSWGGIVANPNRDNFQAVGQSPEVFISLAADSQIAIAGGSLGKGIGIYGLVQNSDATGEGQGLFGEIGGGTPGGGGVGVIGLAGESFGNRTGVFGVTASDSLQSNGVLGRYASLFGNGTGVNGQSFSIADFSAAVSGLMIDPSPLVGIQLPLGTSFGVYGESQSPSANSSGVTGWMIQDGATNGVWGRNFSEAAFSVGVFGSSDAVGDTSRTFGVFGQTTASFRRAAGVMGVGVTSLDGTTSSSGVVGVTDEVGIDDYGFFSGAGVIGASAELGVAGIGLSTGGAQQGTGVVGVGNDNLNVIVLPAGSGGAFSGFSTGVVGFADDVLGIDGAFVQGGYFRLGNGTLFDQQARVAAYDPLFGLAYKIVGNGAVSTIVEDVNGREVVMFAPESPECLFEDLGQGKLVNGRAVIQLDPTFAKNIQVDANHPLRVMVQLEGDCKGVYVTNKTGNGFEVVELNGGTSNVPFTWFVKANRANVNNEQRPVKYADARFPQAPAMEKAVVLQRGIGEGRASNSSLIDAKKVQPTRQMTPGRQQLPNLQDANIRVQSARELHSSSR